MQHKVTEAFKNSDISLSEAFDAYIELIAPPDVSDQLKEIVREAFYAGAIATFGRDDVGYELGTFLDAAFEREKRARPH